jgi:hypothetical protein
MPRSDTRFNLYIHHGRQFPTEDLDGWGQPGPILKNCVGIHSTYQNLYAYFATPEDCNAAKQQTGWEDWRENSLIMRYHHDLLVAKLPDGSFGYFGDWGLIAAEN